MSGADRRRAMLMVQDRGDRAPKYVGSLDYFETGDILPDGDMNVNEEPMFSGFTDVLERRDKAERWWAVVAPSAEEARELIRCTEDVGGTVCARGIHPGRILERGGSGGRPVRS